MADDNLLFPLYVVCFAIAVIGIMAGWIFTLSCLDLLRGAWEAMRNRPWRSPEGDDVYGPGKQPPDKSKRH